MGMLAINSNRDILMTIYMFVAIQVCKVLNQFKASLVLDVSLEWP